MGVDTEGLLNKDVSVLEIKEVLNNIAEDVSIEDNGRGFYTVGFTYRGKTRWMSVFENYASEDLNGEVITLFTLGKHGCANEIVQTVVKYFGGLYVDDDCSGDDPVHLEKTSDYIESEVIKADKKLIKLLQGYDIPLKYKFEIMKFVKENADELVKMSSYY